MSGLNYFAELECRTWGDVADLHGIHLYDMTGDDVLQPNDELFDCILLDELAQAWQAEVYDQTHFTAGVSL